jgi:hypothetical protein
LKLFWFDVLLVDALLHELEVGLEVEMERMNGMRVSDASKAVNELTTWGLL